MKRWPILVLIAALALPAVADEASHRAAALELIDVFGVEANLEQVRAGMIAGMLKQAPETEAYRPTLEAFFDEHLSWDKVESRYVDIYVETFSEKELREVVAFYRTETGRSVVEKLPGVMQRGAAISQHIVSEHQDELRAMIAERQKELQGG